MSGRNYGLVPRMDLPDEQRSEAVQLARLADFMNAEYDADAAKRARDYYGEGVPIEHISAEDKSYFVGAAYARIKGVPRNPEAYWLANKQDVPDMEREDMYEALGKELQQQTRSAWDEQQAKLAAVRESLKRMDMYVRGDDFSEQDLANVRSALDVKTMDDAEAVRNWMLTYMKPLGGVDDSEQVMRMLDGLEDEFFEVIGQDEQRAEMAYNAMLHWAEGVKQSNKVGLSDEFIVAVGKKLSNWGKALEQMQPLAAIAPVGSPDAGLLLPQQQVNAQLQEHRERTEEYERHQASRSILRAAINKSMELGDGVTWWEGAARTAAQMAGESAPYLVPGFGVLSGTADTLVRGATETVDQMQLAGLSGTEAAGQTLIDTGVQAAVELMPLGKVGGMGLSAVTRRLFGEAMENGRAGQFARWVVRSTQKSTARALLVEGTASFVDEGILEPIVAGLATYGAEGVADMVGMKHGKSREFADCFEELTQLFDDPKQAGGLLLFTIGLTGGSAYGVHQNVKYFARHRKMWEAAGLTPEQVDRVMAADDRVELGGKLVREGWETDPAGMRERVLKVNKDFAERGEVLVLTGEGALDAELENSELAPAYRAVWQEYQDKGLLPKVEAVGDNQFHITKEGVDITLDARGADAYLQHVIDEVDRMQTRELQQRLGEEHFVDLRMELADAVSTIAGGAAMRAAEAASERTGIAVADITKGLPEWLADGIVKRGQITLKDAQDITEWAIGRIDGLVQEGMSPADARLTRASADGMARTLGDWSTFARYFAHREQLAGLKPGEGAVSISRTRNEQAVVFDGRQVLGQTIMPLPGNVRHQGAVEDVTESFADMMVQQRAAVIREANPESTPAEAEAQAWQELGEVVQRARSAVLKADSSAEIEEVKPGDEMSIIEALSTMATSKFVASGAVPGWMQSLTAALKGNLAAADSLAKVRAAYSSVLQHDPAAVSELDTMLNKLGVYVQDTFREARIEAVDIQAWKHARALVTARAESPAGSGGAPVSEVVKQAGENYELRVAKDEFESSAATPQEAAREAQEILDGMVPGSNAPAEMQGVFVDDKCYYNAAGGFWCGMIDKHKLRDGTEQVKVGAKGKHGVIAGRELTGRFQQNVGAIYVWRRTSGELQVISGRHRFAKLMEDDSAQSCNAYVFVEDAAHDERWARMLDYENNMRDDQADEVTAATYVRETGLSDAELEVRGLMRNGTRCKRGALIGRFAREELWTRFINGAVKPMDAEVICNLTRSIREQSRVEEIQRRCCMLLDEKKSWEYIGAMVQLMANKENVVLKQGLLNFGADFEADLARAAEWIERNIKAINESVTLLKQGRKLSGKKRAEAERLGISTATQEGTEQMLYDLELLRGQFEMIGSYPDLVAAAQMWDGVTAVDPVGQYLERARAEREQARTEGEMDAEEYLESHLDDATGEFSFSIFNERRWANDVWPTRAMKKIEADWLERLDAYIAEYQAAKANPNMKRPMGREIYVCPTPGVLSLVGVTSRDVVTTRHALDHDMFTKHGMTRKALRHLPSAISDPICIAESQSVPGALEILTTLTETVEDSKTKALVKKNVLVALHVGLKSTETPALIVSKIASAYGKNRIKTILDTHKILYWNDQKGKVMLNNYRLQLPQAIQHDLSTGNIWDFNDLVKYKQQNKFSFSMERNLAAVHSLSPEKFLGALELGGMPMPSVAITRLDRPYGWGGAGNIMLVGRPALVDPKAGTEVYSRDAWTGNFPRVVHKVIGKKERSDSVSDLRDMRTKYQATGDYNSDIHQLDYRINMDYGGEKTSRSDMDYGLRQRTGKALFAWQSGYQPRPKTKEATRVHEWLTKEVASRLRRYVSLSPDEYHEKWPEIKEEVRQEIEKVYRESSVIKKAPTPEAAEKRLTSWVNVALRAFDAYSPSALEKELEDVKKIDARVLDIEANLDMLAKYADKHKKAYEEWIVQKLNAWFSKERYIHGTKKEATLDNLAEYMLGKKSRGEETGLAFSSGLVRAHQAERLYSLEDIKERREKLTDSEISKSMKEETHEWMSEWRDGVAEILARGSVGHDFSVRDDAMETLSKVKGAPTAEKLRTALRKMFRGASNLQTLLNDAEVINAGVEALKSLHAELEDYMEAVPQRAVRMNEWEYAVMPEGLKKNKAVMAGLRENGIRPRFHDGTEEGRKAALAGLVNDAKVSFNVIGPSAKTWPKYVDRAFAGRDDGKMRAEIDASRAKLKWEDLRGKNVAAYRRIVAGWDNLPEAERKQVETFAEQVYDWQDESQKLNSTPENEFLEQYNKVIKLRDTLKPQRAEIRSLLNKIFVEHGGGAAVVLNMKDAELDELALSLWGPYVESKVEDMLDLRPLWHGGMKLADVLEYPELYEAYPELADITVRYATMDTARGRALYHDGEHEILINRNLEGEWRSIHSILLHEIQHHIQNIEGFAKGGNPSSARRLVDNRAAMGDADAMALRERSDMELYDRIAGEIEARNVQARYGWSMDRREAIPFNSTLEYPGEALVTYNMERASLRALDLLTIRADERAGEQLIKDWQAACENWGRFGREDAGRLGNGAKMLGEMQALIGATKGVLPERYCRMGHLNGLMRWASIYAKMQQDGTLPQVGEIKGPIYQKFLEKLQQADELNRLQGMSEQEAQEAMALLAGERLDTAIMKVARECRRRLEIFLKDRELERIDHIVEKAYPKRQNGQKWPRGKMAADAYRRMERARQYMNLPADEVAELINDAKRKLNALDATDADFERKEEELEEEISLLQTFGCWENMGFEQARRACGVMTEMVLLGRARWKEKLQAERRRANYDRAQISRNFRTKLADVQRKRAKTDAKEKARKRTIAKNLAMGSMSYSQLMLALEPKLGKEFTGRHMRMIAKAHERLQLGTQQLHRRMFSTLSEITGLKTEGEMEEWLKSNNEIIDTGIVLKPRFTETCRMTPEEVEEWLALSEAQREVRRKQADEEAAAKGELPDNVPSEDALERMREKLEASRKAGTTPKEYVVTVERRYESPLHCTKEAMLFAILTFEQDDYVRLMDVNGVNEKALQRMRELVGDKLLRWGYAMREMLNEQGLTMAAVYEAHTGVPFAKRANYFRGVFDIAKAKDKGESIDSATSITGGKYGCLIPRQYHNQMLNWGTSATQVFIGTYKEQQNYICTSHISREWRTLLSNQGFEKRLRAEIGDAALDTIHGWCKLIDGSVIADAKVNAMMNRLLGKVMGAYAVSRLAGNVYTIIKQVSGVLNGFVGGYVPEQVLVGDAVAQQLTYRHIGFGEYAAALARAMSGQTEISAEEIANAGFIAGRKRVEGAHLEEAAMLAPGQSVPGKVGRAGRAVYEANMDAIGYVDRKGNTLAALAVADAVYRAAKRENKDGLVPDAELRRIAIETAGMAIDRAAQPQLRTQKGYWAAGGGAFGAMGNFFYMFKSEVLGKLGLYVGQMFAGHHGAWIGGALSFGVLNSLVLALIDYVRGYWYDDEEDKWEKRAKQFAWNILANDISAVPVLGDLEGWGRSTLLGGRPWNSSLVDMVVPFKDMYTYGKREVRNVAEGESWDKHVQALCGFARALGAAGGWWQGNSRVAVGSCAELALAVAAISNIVRFGKDAVKKVVGEEE